MNKYSYLAILKNSKIEEYDKKKVFKSEVNLYKKHHNSANYGAKYLFFRARNQTAATTSLTSGIM